MYLPFIRELRHCILRLPVALHCCDPDDESCDFYDLCWFFVLMSFINDGVNANC